MRIPSHVAYGTPGTGRASASVGRGLGSRLPLWGEDRPVGGGSPMRRGGRLPRSPEGFGRDLLGVAAGVLVVEVTSARRGGLRPCEAGVGHHWGQRNGLPVGAGGDVQGMQMAHPFRRWFRSPVAVAALSRSEVAPASRCRYWGLPWPRPGPGPPVACEAELMSLADEANQGKRWDLQGEPEETPAACGWVCREIQAHMAGGLLYEVESTRGRCRAARPGGGLPVEATRPPVRGTG